MKFFESLALALSAILAHKLRSFLTLLGIIFGVATVIVVVSLIEGFNKYFNDKIADLGSNAFVVNKMGIVTSMQSGSRETKKTKTSSSTIFARLRTPYLRQRRGCHYAKAGQYKARDSNAARPWSSLASARIWSILIRSSRSRPLHTSTEEEHSRYACFIGYGVATSSSPALIQSIKNSRSRACRSVS